MTRIAVIIPCYKVKKSILQLIEQIGNEVDRIYVVDDCCPEQSGKLVEDECLDERVSVIFNQKNLGVGGAVITGYKKALEDGADILVKIDGDGQMKPELISFFVKPIMDKVADYTKGNRFFYLSSLKDMPWKRVIGNLILSFVTKMSSGYWNIIDPTNGYTAISANALNLLSLEVVNKRYFFESDMLFHLGMVRAVVMDVPMRALYPVGNISNFCSYSNIPVFIWGNIKNFCKRVVYSYYIRNFTIASIQLILAIIFLIFGIVMGIDAWMNSIDTSVPATAGTVMLSALPIIVGMQLLLSFINYDITSVPTIPLADGIKGKS